MAPRRIVVALLVVVGLVVGTGTWPAVPSQEFPNVASAASGATAVVPPNYNLAAGPLQVGPGPTNFDFSSGCTGWSKTTQTTGDLPAILTTQEACQLLRISRATLYAEVHAGRIPALWIGKRCLRFSRVALERWLELEAAGVA